ncbi:hypothetical protein PSTT_00173 [Puccinia striiformis]|uniref:Uncharacterized protein n=1 Tax=Puccinia striiformis TaxID=27350 RepID=A0A2S4W867_9BASI|nr:hypothetical protein PSTT_00173 [Puccinia striiformis]
MLTLFQRDQPPHIYHVCFIFWNIAQEANTRTPKVRRARPLGQVAEQCKREHIARATTCPEARKLISSSLIAAHSTTVNKRNCIDKIDRTALEQRITDIHTGESAEGHSSDYATLEESERSTKITGSSLATCIETGR